MAEWISVKEQAPCHLQKALTCDAHGNIHVFTYFDGSRYPFNIGPNHPKFYEPTHWMPLPEPPEESTMGQVNQMEQSAKPRICQVLGVEVGERFSIDGYPADYGLVQVCEDGKIRRVISTEEFPFADDSEVGNKIGSNVLYYLLNHPDRIIRKPRFTEDEVADAKVLMRALRATGLKRNRYEDIYATSDTAADTLLDSEMFPSLRPGQAVTLEEIINATDG